MIGKTISHYKIIEQLGAGGMGIVYKAEDTKLKRTVALKFLPPELTRDEDAKNRFIHEAQAASALEHNNICNIHEIEQTDDGQLFVVMACYEGEILKEKIERGPLKIDEAVDIAIQISQGLIKAHEKGIIHRDIKPSNIFITTDGIVKIIDFGLAKLAGRTVLTKEGTTLGTINYMSPEQTKGEHIDHRTDIWSLGTVFYEMITGQAPFKGEYEQAIIYSIINENPDAITAIRTGVPMELERIINKTLAKKPEERCQHMDELLTDLKKLKQQPSSGKETVPIPLSHSKKIGENKSIWRRMMPIIFAGLAIVLLLLMLQWIYHDKSKQSITIIEKSIAVLPLTTFTQSEEDEIFSEGMHDDIITQLAKIHNLKVIARTSVMQYKNKQKSVREIGKELGVGSILEGSVRRAGNQIRIVAQLIDASTEEHIWAETYDRDYTNVFAIQSDVAQQIASALQATLTTEEKSLIETVPTENMEAYDYYLKGNYYWNNYATREGNEQAIRMYEKAVQLDPDFALAWARLAIVDVVLVSVATADYPFCFNIDWSGRTPDIRLRDKYLQKAKTALDRALTINSDLAENHFARGNYLMMITADYEQAQKEFDAALRKQPNNSEIVQLMGFNGLHQRKMAQAVEYFKREYELNPQALFSGGWVNYTYEFMRKWPEAEKWANLFIAKRPEDGVGYCHKVNIYSWGYGNVKEALAVWEEGMSLAKERRQLLGSFKYDLLLCARNYTQALSSLAADSSNRFNIISLGEVYRLMGNLDQAFAQYDSARVIYENLTREASEIPFYHSALGLAYAGLARKDEAIREGRRAVALQPIKSDMYWNGERLLLNLAHIYIMVGVYDQAIDEFETLLSIPSQLTVWRLKLDPRYDALRILPRFQKLLDKYSERAG